MCFREERIPHAERHEMPVAGGNLDRTSTVDWNFLQNNPLQSSSRAGLKEPQPIVAVARASQRIRVTAQTRPSQRRKKTANAPNWCKATKKLEADGNPRSSATTSQRQRRSFWTTLVAGSSPFGRERARHRIEIKPRSEVLAWRCRSNSRPWR
jgi:hypothetical protein